MRAVNCYEDAKRAEAYASLEFHGTYYLAYRDIAKRIFEHIEGGNALDFGCGTGRSTRYLKDLGFETVGVDISKEMIKFAVDNDPKGVYHLITEGGLKEFNKESYDLVLSAFTFDNIAGMDNKIKIFKDIKRLLKPDGILLSLVSSPEIYVNEWVSFSTKNFPENRDAKGGDIVRIVMTDVDDERPVEDIVCFDEDYQKCYRESKLSMAGRYELLASGDEPYDWVSETAIAPWVIYVLKKDE